jgi:hypothetical protein
VWNIGNVKCVWDILSWVFSVLFSTGVWFNNEYGKQMSVAQWTSFGFVELVDVKIGSPGWDVGQYDL